MFRSIVAAALLSSGLGAQALGDVPTVYNLSAGFGSGLTTLSASASRSTYVGTSGRFMFGLAARTTAVVTSGIELTPVDPLGFATPVDVLSVSGSGVTLNIGITTGLELTNRLSVGFNLDLFGFSVGSGSTGSYYPTPGSAAEQLTSKIASPNLFLGGDGDRGVLNSEFFLAWTLNDRFALRGGLSHQAVEFKVNPETIDSGTPRFRKFANLVFVGLRVSTPQ
ncbi:MAG: hypothetical protein O2973_11630 [Gemmatimonadetes bacterium]|nr:hypothetical protein [Gemmatimonadota bacterium]